MRCLAILLLLCAATGLATPASAHDCPTGMRQAWSADRAALAKVGDEAFRSHIAGFCNKMPIYVTEPSYFRASEWRRRVSFAASPCALGCCRRRCRRRRHVLQPPTSKRAWAAPPRGLWSLCCVWADCACL